MEKIKEMSIDLETYSDVDIKKSGVYKYAESENFEILLFAVSINGDDVIVYDLACGDVLPDEILDAIVSDDVIKWAFNASFERIPLTSIPLPTTTQNGRVAGLVVTLFHFPKIIPKCLTSNPRLQPDIHFAVDMFPYKKT